jgi:hypothetical protein
MCCSRKSEEKELCPVNQRGKKSVKEEFLMGITGEMEKITCRCFWEAAMRRRGRKSFVDIIKSFFRYLQTFINL